MNTQLYTIDPLFDFQVVCDTDMGLYNLIKEEYYDRSIFDNELFDATDERFVKTVLLSREYFNPLFIFCKKGVLSNEEMDNLYQEFLEKEYDKIIKLSPPTSIMNIASVSNSVNKLVNVNILCKNKQEKQWIMDHDYKLKCIISDYKNFDLQPYDTIYIKDIYTLLSFKQDTIKNKNIIIPRFMFNLEISSKNMEIPIIEVSEKYYKQNKFMITAPYKDIWVPVTEME